ncbi:MAG: hypothetical protein OEY11_03795 [Gammaproteobacteria bacterium]|nr:hypothetical protein [Gammaproteobacteria bacterium]
MNNRVKYKTLCYAVIFSVLAGCASTQATDDPLKYSKKLIKEGHSSLYTHGAFAVPNTQIKLIPAGPEPLELAKEMMGMRAREAFLSAIKNAADAVYIIPEGTELSLDIAKKVVKSSQKAGSGMTAVTRSTGMLLINKSSDIAKSMVLDSWQLGKASASSVDRVGVAIEKASIKTGDSMTQVTDALGQSIVEGSLATSSWLSREGTEGARQSLIYAGNKFIKGYAAVPRQLGKRGTAIAQAFAPDNFTKGLKRSNIVREQYSETFTDLIGSTVTDYGKNVGESFRKAGESFDDTAGPFGFSFATIKWMRWVLQGVLWDGLVSPVVKLSTGSVGYIAVNAVAFPVMVVVEEGVAATKLAVEVSWNTAAAVYDLVAPTAVSAVASVYSVFQFTGGNLAAGAAAVGGVALGGAELISGQVIGQSVKAVGYIAGKGVQYIGVPLTAAGVTVGSGAVGVVAGSAAAVTGGAVMVAGEAASVTTQAFGTVIGGATLVAGTSASVVAGAGVGIYELSKAVIVPAGYELGGGIVLGYGTMAQLGAHSVLAVADASYMVLSLEGPKWVLYAVTGKLGNGDKLPVGTVLDLEAMQQSGEEFKYLDISKEEMTSVVNSIYEELPEQQDEDSPEQSF